MNIDIGHTDSDEIQKNPYTQEMNNQHDQEFFFFKKRAINKGYSVCH